MTPLLAFFILLLSQSQAFSPSRVLGRMYADQTWMMTTTSTATISHRKSRLSQLYLLSDADDIFDDEYDEGGITTMTTTTTDASTRNLGEKLIMDAVALTCGDDVDRTVTIEWKGRGGSPRIIVTVDTSDDDDDDYYDDEDDYDNVADNMVDNWDGDDDYDDDDEDELLENIDEDDDLIGDEDSSLNDVPTSGNLLTRIARRINEAFARDAPDGPGYSIAKIYDIEVTTPPFDGVLRGRRMFHSYRGFDVVVEHYEKKKSKKNGSVEVGVEEPRKLKTSEGKLVSRDKEADGNTTINSKGRAVKIKNEDIMTVRLPKAKREKGVR
jgi:ribosome maturation factor RimP